MAHQRSVIALNLVKLLAVVFRDLGHRMFGLTPDGGSLFGKILPFHVISNIITHGNARVLPFLQLVELWVRLDVHRIVRLPCLSRSHVRHAMGILVIVRDQGVAQPFEIVPALIRRGFHPLVKHVLSLIHI